MREREIEIRQTEIQRMKKKLTNTHNQIYMHKSTEEKKPKQR